MIIAKEMNKPTVKVSVSDSDSSSIEESEGSENEEELSSEDVEADAESVSSEDGEKPERDLLLTNEGWADSVAKILGSSKPKNKKTLVLSRAKKFTEVVKKEEEKKPSFEVIGEEQEQKPEVKKDPESLSEPPVKKKKHDRPSIRVKPKILEKDRERLLAKIATKGVVQLFNAVRNQQKTLEKEMDGNIPESKKEKILKKFDKRTFLDTLMGQTKSVVVDKVEPLKNEVKDEEKPRWSALRDDFMMGAKMKDWDKESGDDE